MLTLYFILVQTLKGESVYCGGVVLMADVANIKMSRLENLAEVTFSPM